ncbi:MAG: TonB-dependent receptor [Candidatus Aureabacteria bacterium]|nr:TonB-dependent receptor [Candidatus Auribacterota bacterium]
MKMKHLIIRGMVFILGVYPFSLEAQVEESGLYSLYSEIPLVYTPSKSEEKSSDAPGVISVVTKDELNRFGGTTLKDILERVPGLARASVYFSDRSIMSIRGQQFKENGVLMLLLINGRPIREDLEGGIVCEVLETFPVNIIEKIEVIKGPGSVLYGSGAFAGIINVITEKIGKTGGTVTALFGEKYDARFKASVLKGDFSLLLSGQARQRPDWDLTYARNDDVGHHEGDFTMEDRGSGLYAEMNYKNLRVMASYDQWQTLMFDPKTEKFLIFGFDELFGDVTWKKTFGDIGYKLPVSDIWDMDFNLTYVRSQLRPGKFPYVTRDSDITTAEWTNIIKPTDMFGIVFGGTYTYTEGTEYWRGNEVKFVPGGLPPYYLDDSSRNSYGFYTQFDYWAKRDVLKLIAGAQINKVEDVKLVMVPRGGLIYYFTSEFNVKALYSKAFRAPGLNEVYAYGPGLLYGTKDLDAETADTYDVDFNFNNDKVQLGMNFFYSKLQNLIRLTFDLNYYNMDSVSSKGVGIEGKYFISDEFFLQASAIYNTTKNEDTGEEDVVPIANTGAKFGASYHSDSGILLSLYDIYQGELDDKYTSSGDNPRPGSYNLLNFYSSFDLGKILNWQGVSVVFKVDNLLDKQLWLVNWGRAPLSIPVLKGRTIYAGASVSF